MRALVAILFLSTVADSLGQDYRERFQAAQQTGDQKAIQTNLDEWKAARPDDPEYYIAAANRAYGRHQGVVISTKPAAAGDIEVADQKTGKAVGSVGEGKPNAADFKEAIGLLKQGLAKAPQRIDIYLGMATLDEDSGDLKNVVNDLASMAAYAKAHPDRLQGKDGTPYPVPANERLALAINLFANQSFQRGTPAGDRAFHELAGLDAQAYPELKYGYNLLGIYYTTVDKKSDLAQNNFSHALAIAPEDSLLWINVGLLHARDGKKKEAAAAFQKVLDLNNNAECVGQAKAELAKLR